MKPYAVGIHVFAGGFSAGAMKHLDTKNHLEIHGFGLETAEQLGVKCYNAPSWHNWEKECRPCVVYGNPRCTAFSTLSAGSGDAVHGASAKCTQDIRDLFDWCLWNKENVQAFCFESVQQAMTTGKPLIDELAERAGRDGYRVAHVFINTRLIGSCQNRKRYFFVGYKDGLIFNAVDPREHHDGPPVTVRDCIEKFMDREVNESPLYRKPIPYQPDSYNKLYDTDKSVLHYLKQGQSLNDIADSHYDLLPSKMQMQVAFAESQIPFSLHCPTRLRWDDACPTIHSGCGNLIHPEYDRAITVRELAALMGWPPNFLPIGPLPVAQIAKGVCPEAGAWIADALARCVRGENKDDYGVQKDCTMYNANGMHVKYCYHNKEVVC